MTVNKYTVLKVVWSIAIFSLLLWITVQNNLSQKMINLGFSIITDNQEIINNNILNKCKGIDI